MELIEVNNTIVKMRKSVIKAKVHLIRDLLKQVKSLKNKKGTDDQKTKNNRKADRIVKELDFIKTVKKDIVSRFALENEGANVEINPEKVTADEMEELLKKRALARLSNQKVMKSAVNEFRSKYPNWRKELPAVLKVLGKKQQKKNEKAKKKKKQESKKPENAKNEVKTEDDEQNDSDQDDEEGAESEFVASLKQSLADTKEEQESESESDNDNSEDSEEEEEKSEQELEAEPEVVKAEPVKLSKREGQLEIKTINVKKERESDSSDDEDDSSENDSKPEVPTKTDPPQKAIKDSFFLGGGGGSDSDNEESEGEGDFSRKDFNTDEAVTQKRFDFFGRGEHRGRRGGQDRQDPGRGRGHARGRDSRGGRGFGRGRGGQDAHRGGRGSRGDASFRGGQRGRGGGHWQQSDDRKRPYPQNDFHDHNLHPSWSAKKKQNLGISSFSGKKTTFGDDGPAEIKSFSTTKTPSSSEKLHPSWAAKKEQSGIQAFKGKKVVFGDDD